MAIVGPIAPYSNVPINAQYYKPSRFVISNITRGVTTVVTTTQDHNYVVGQQVRLIIPPTFGIRQLNERQAFVISIPNDDEVELDISSSFMDAFISSLATTKAQILAIGDVNSGTINTSGTVNLNNVIPGSFTNISPN